MEKVEAQTRAGHPGGSRRLVEPRGRSPSLVVRDGYRGAPRWRSESRSRELRRKRVKSLQKSDLGFEEQRYGAHLPRSRMRRGRVCLSPEAPYHDAWSRNRSPEPGKHRCEKMGETHGGGLWHKHGGRDGQTDSRNPASRARKHRTPSSRSGERCSQNERTRARETSRYTQATPGPLEREVDPPQSLALRRSYEQRNRRRTVSCSRRGQRQDRREERSRRQRGRCQENIGAGEKRDKEAKDAGLRGEDGERRPRSKAFGQSRGEACLKERNFKEEKEERQERGPSGHLAETSSRWQEGKGQEEKEEKRKEGDQGSQWRRIRRDEPRELVRRKPGELRGGGFGEQIEKRHRRGEIQSTAEEKIRENTRLRYEVADREDRGKPSRDTAFRNFLRPNGVGGPQAHRILQPSLEDNTGLS